VDVIRTQETGLYSGNPAEVRFHSQPLDVAVFGLEEGVMTIPSIEINVWKGETDVSRASYVNDAGQGNAKIEGRTLRGSQRSTCGLGDISNRSNRI
jgi:hypothetical protein